MQENAERVGKAWQAATNKVMIKNKFEEWGIDELKKLGMEEGGRRRIEEENLRIEEGKRVQNLFLIKTFNYDVIQIEDIIFNGIISRYEDTYNKILDVKKKKQLEETTATIYINITDIINANLPKLEENIETITGEVVKTRLVSPLSTVLATVMVILEKGIQLEDVHKQYQDFIYEISYTFDDIFL